MVVESEMVFLVIRYAILSLTFLTNFPYFCCFPFLSLHSRPPPSNLRPRRSSCHEELVAVDAAAAVVAAVAVAAAATRVNYVHAQSMTEQSATN